MHLKVVRVYSRAEVQAGCKQKFRLGAGRSPGWVRAEVQAGCGQKSRLGAHSTKLALSLPGLCTFNLFKLNRFFHSYNLEESILHFRGVRLIFFFISLT